MDTETKTAEAAKEPSAAELREQAIRERMRAGNMTRENAELVIEHQAAADKNRKPRKK